MEQQYPLPTIDELSDFYDDSYDQGLYKLFVAAERMKQVTAAYRLEHVRPWLPDGHWLDVGAANGVFVDAASQEGIDAEGVELSDRAAAAGRAQDLRVHTATLEEFSSTTPFDAITAFDVIEHVLDPLEFLRHICRHLRPGGRVALSTPNLASVHARIMGRRWYFYIPEEHTFYLNPLNAAQLLVRAGFEPVHHERFSKPLTINYGLSQLADYNPMIHKLTKPIAQSLPVRFTELVLPLYIGEMLLIGERPARL